MNTSDMREKLRILVVVGTVRENRVGRTVADWYIREARKIAKHLEFELYDLAELDLPIFTEPVSPMMHKYSNTQKRLAETVGAADGFVFVTGEYNHSIPGSLKNFLDYLNAEWSHKVAAYVGYGSMGGVRAIEHLVQVMNELRCASVRDTIHIDQIWSALDDDGIPKSEHLYGDVDKQLSELTWWASALKSARDES